MIVSLGHYQWGLDEIQRAWGRGKGGRRGKKQDREDGEGE